MDILFYGGGNIAQAVIKGLIASGYEKKQVKFLDRNKSNRKTLSSFDIKECKSLGMEDHFDLIILCVKPKDAMKAVQDIASVIKKPAILSLVAGISAKKYLSVSKNIKLIRGMPNTSSEFKKGITAFCNINAPKNLYFKTQKLFSRIGVSVNVSSEKKMDDYTGLVGSGPAYFFHLLQVYEKHLLKITENDNKLTKLIISNLMMGVGKSVIGDKSLEELISSVASKKGTTEAGLKSMKENQVSSSFNKSIKAAIKRSKEISSEF
jgi:pyrroline-5-carboxylate reductase